MFSQNFSPEEKLDKIKQKIRHHQDELVKLFRAYDWLVQENEMANQPFIGPVNHKLMSDYVKVLPSPNPTIQTPKRKINIFHSPTSAPIKSPPSQSKYNFSIMNYAKKSPTVEHEKNINNNSVQVRDEPVIMVENSPVKELQESTILDIATPEIVPLTKSQVNIDDELEDILQMCEKEAEPLKNQKVTIEIEDSEPELDFKYVESCRKKEDREKLKGFDCIECREYYKGLDIDPAELQQRMKTCSRHRAMNSPVKAPAGFWSPGPIKHSPKRITNPRLAECKRALRTKLKRKYKIQNKNLLVKKNPEEVE